MIIDTAGAVIGLLMSDYIALFPHPHGIGKLPVAAGIIPALELLSLDYAEKPYVDGPLMIAITNEKATSMHFSDCLNYDVVNGA